MDSKGVKFSQNPKVWWDYSLSTFSELPYCLNPNPKGLAGNIRGLLVRFFFQVQVGLGEKSCLPRRGKNVVKQSSLTFATKRVKI